MQINNYGEMTTGEGTYWPTDMQELDHGVHELCIEIQSDSNKQSIQEYLNPDINNGLCYVEGTKTSAATRT